MRRICETNCTGQNFQFLAVVGGYDILIPTYYYITNPLGIGCRLWLKTNNAGICEVVEIETADWEHELSQYIQDNLPAIEGPICRYLTPVEGFVMELSGRIYDYHGNIMAEIRTYDRVPQHIDWDVVEDELDIIPSMEIAVSSVRNRESVGALMENILLRHPVIENHKGVVLWYDTTGEDDYSEEMAFTPTDYGFSYRHI